HAWVAALSMLLLPAAALADHEEDFLDDFRRQGHVHTSSCNHVASPVPPGQPTQYGRYELQTNQKWVPGRYEQVWVPRVCRKGHHRRPHHGGRCWGGHYEQQWREGYFQTVQEWVWVPTSRPEPRFGLYVSGAL
ncbi:MAG: hypothetical protein ACOZIN_19475, partial [Myxococcota bacterium]